MELGGGGRGEAGAATVLLLLAGAVMLAVLLCFAGRCQERSEAEEEGGQRRRRRWHRHRRPPLASSRRPPCWGVRWGGAAAPRWSTRVTRGGRRRRACQRQREESRAWQRTQREERRAQRAASRARQEAAERAEAAERCRAQARAMAARRAALALLATVLLVLWQVSYLGIRVGEAAVPGHRQADRAWRVTTINVTALTSTRSAVVVETLSDVLALQEVRLGGQAQRAMARDLDQKGWRAVWGKPQPLLAPAHRHLSARTRESIWYAQQGGVGVLVRKGIPAHAAPRDTPTRRWLWDTGRWVHAVVGHGDGSQVLHVISVYGYTGQEKTHELRQQNEALLRGTFEAAAELGNVHILIMGDINVLPEESAMLQAARMTGRWVDVADAIAQAQGREPQPTTKRSPGARRVDPVDGAARTRQEFLTHYGGTKEWDGADAPAADAAAGNRIDVIIASAEAAATIDSCEVEADSEYPTHNPVHATMQVAQYGQTVKALRRPQGFPVDSWEKWDEEREEQEAERALRDSPTDWSAVTAATDVEQLWSDWSEAAEAYLIARSGTALVGPAGRAGRYRGRGRCRGPVDKHLAAQQGKGDDGALVVAQRRVQRLLRRFEELERRIVRHRALGVGVTPHHLVTLWSAIRRAGAVALPSEPWSDVWARSELPDNAERRRLAAELHAEADRLARGERAGRLAAWKEWIRTCWLLRRGAVFDWCRNAPRQEVTMMRRKDGSLTGNVLEMDGLLREAWSPIFCLYSPSSPEPAWGPFADRFGNEKAFDRIPQAILMELLRRLGLDPRIVGALQAMYRGLRRRFRVAGSVGQPFAATNGILQGCPVSMVALNAIVAVWARAVEAEARGCRTAAFADDKWCLAGGIHTPAGEVARALQQAAKVSEDFADLTGERFNVSKTFQLGTTPEARRRVQLRGAKVRVIAHARGLGVQLSSRQARRSRLAAERVRAARAVAARVSCLPMTLEEKAVLLAAAASPRGIYGCAVTPYSQSQLQSLRRAFAAALFPKHKRRCLEIVFTLMVKGHLLDPEQAVPYQCLRTLRDMADRRPELRARVERTWHARRRGAEPQAPGPLRQVQEAAALLGWEWLSPWTFRTADGRTLHYPRMEKGAWEHELREAGRQAAWRRAEARRRLHHDDFAGIAAGIDQRATMALSGWRRLDGLSRGFLRVIIAGAVYTQARLYEMKLVDSAACPHCAGRGDGGPTPTEDQQHIWWDCPAWAHIRARHPDAMDAYREGGAGWPACFRLNGVAPVDLFEPEAAGGQREVERGGLQAPAAEAAAPAAPAAGETIVDGRVRVYTDGAASNNQDPRFRRAGSGAWWAHGHARNVSEPVPAGAPATNNRGELYALVRVLETDPRRLEVCSDSQWCLDRIRRDLQRWRGWGWRKGPSSARRPPHVDLWRRLDAALAARPEGHVLFRKVKGHASARDVAAGRVAGCDRAGNDAADALAVAGAALHGVDPRRVAAARRRVEAARAVQALMLDVARERARRRERERLRHADATEGAEEERGAQAAGVHLAPAEGGGAAPRADAAARAPAQGGAGGGVGAAAAGAPAPPPASDDSAPARQRYPWGWDPPGARTSVGLSGADALPPPRAHKKVNKGETSVVHGPDLWYSMLRYLRGLRWPPADAPGGGPGITWLEMCMDFEVVTGYDVPRTLRADGLTPTGAPAGAGPLGERARVFAQAMQQLERLLGEHTVPGGVAAGAKRQLQLGALGVPPSHALTGIPRRPVLAGGAETEKALRRLADAGGNVLDAGGWLGGVRPDYRRVRRGDAREWTAAPAGGGGAGEDAGPYVNPRKMARFAEEVRAVWRRCGCDADCRNSGHRYTATAVAAYAGQKSSSLFGPMLRRALPGVRQEEGKGKGKPWCGLVPVEGAKGKTATPEPLRKGPLAAAPGNAAAPAPAAAAAAAPAGRAAGHHHLVHQRHAAQGGEDVADRHGARDHAPAGAAEAERDDELADRIAAEARRRQPERSLQQAAAPQPAAARRRLRQVQEEELAAARLRRRAQEEELAAARRGEGGRARRRGRAAAARRRREGAAARRGAARRSPHDDTAARPLSFSLYKHFLPDSVVERRGRRWAHRCRQCAAAAGADNPLAPGAWSHPCRQHAAAQPAPPCPHDGLADPAAANPSHGAYAQQGGVGVLVRKGIPAHAAPRD
eukprot:gene6048-8598_t